MKKILILFIFFTLSLNLIFASNSKLEWYKYLVPAYWWSFGYNNDLLNLKDAVIILNPSNWEFSSSEPVFIDLIQRSKYNNNLVIWYVYTWYWKRNFLDIKNNIDNYLKFYNIDWFFLDEASSSKDKIDFYKKIYNYIKSKDKNLLVFLNPWITPDKWYLNISDNIIIYENPCNNYKDFFPPIWLKNYPNSKFSFLWLECNQEDNKKLTQKYGKYLTYFTEDWKDWNPWDTFSKYYNKKTKEINKQKIEAKKTSTSTETIKKEIKNSPLVNKSIIKTKSLPTENQNKTLFYIIWLLSIIILILLIKR